MPHFLLKNLKATNALGKIIAENIKAPLIIYLEGDLGAGKTTLARAIIQNLGFHGNIKSPSYSIVEVYTISRLYLYHFDFYRFLSPEEFEEAGLIEYFNEKNDRICLVEWPQNAAPFVPTADLRIHLFAENNEEARGFNMVAHSKAGEKCLKRILPNIQKAF